MALNLRKLNELVRVETFLQGGVLSGKNLSQGLYGLHGLTLILKSPLAGTVTFATTPANAQGFLTFKEILDQINAESGGGWASTKAKGLRGELVLIEDTPTSGVTVDKTGTANALLGFPTSADLAGKVFNAPGGGTPELVSVTMIALNNYYLVITDE